MTRVRRDDGCHGRRQGVVVTIRFWTRTALVGFFFLLSSPDMPYASPAIRERFRLRRTRRELLPPLFGMCVGDCQSNDAMCEMGLSCYERSRLQVVPGCEAETRGDGSERHVCYKPPPGVLVHVGGYDSATGGFRPRSAFPLSRCHGDCQSDIDCGGNLKCLVRQNINEHVPGCNGWGKPGVGYCYDATVSDSSVTVHPLTVRNAAPTVPSSLGRCQGNCRGDDSLCHHRLSCFKRDRREQVPGCEGRGVRGVDYCYEPPPGVLVYVGDRDPATGIVKPHHAVFPLQACQGRCNSNDDCLEGLECFTPIGDAVVPGCNSTGIPGLSYCFDPTRIDSQAAPPISTAPITPVPTELVPTTLAPTTPAPTTPAPTTSAPTQTFSPTSMPELHLRGGEAAVGSLGNCQGDCIRDDVLCQYGLSCFNRLGIEPVPGCTGQGLSGSGYCYKPPENTLVYMGEDGNADVENPVFPLGACQGDCDDDWDCQTGLLCYFREDYEPVPGCKGRGVQGRDYCYKPKDGVDSNSQNPEDGKEASLATEASGGGGSLSNAAVISIIVIVVVVANICLCVSCKWLLSRDPINPAKVVNGKEQPKVVENKTAPPPPLEADGGILIKSVKSGAGVNASEGTSEKKKKVNFADSIRVFGQLNLSTNPAGYNEDNTNDIT